MSPRIEFDDSKPKLAQRIKKMRASAVRDLFSAATRSDVISLAGGMPDVSLMPKDAICQAVLASVEDDGLRAQALQYGSTDGRLGTRQVVCSLMRDVGVRCRPENVILTSGSQSSLDLIGKTFIDPGDIIITEGPTYLAALQAFSAYEPEFVSVDMDGFGMKTDLLEETLQGLGSDVSRVKFVYVIPDFQNPTGVTLAADRRKKLIELSKKYGFLIVEDAPYSRLRYGGGHQIPIKALYPDVIYLGTISKIMAPGLRVGWVVAPQHVVRRLNLAKQGTDLCSSSIDQIIVEQYFNNNNWQRILSTFVDTYRKRRDAMLSAMEEFFPPEVSWTRPEGGMFIWVTLPKYMDTGSLLAQALEAGVTFVPGDSFYPNGCSGKNCMRVNFSFEQPEMLREAVHRLAKVIEERLEIYRVFLDAGAIKSI